MDWTVKQALGVVIVVLLAILCIGAGITSTNSNNSQVEQKQSKLWETVDTIQGELDGSINP